MFKKFFKNYYAVSMVSLLIALAGVFLYTGHGFVRITGILLFLLGLILCLINYWNIFKKRKQTHS